MNKEKVLNVVAGITKKVALTNASSRASVYYVYQPMVPLKLRKAEKK